MGLDHTQPAYSERAAPWIEKFGGKIGGLKFLEYASPQLRKQILPMVTIKPDEEWDGRLPPAFFDRDVIVRASDPADFQGLVDVLKTNKLERGTMRVPQSEFVKSIRDQIAHIKEHAQRPDVLQYARYENPAYNGGVIIAIQPFVTSHEFAE